MTAPTDVTFSQGTVISSTWLNGVNAFVNIAKGNTSARPTSPFVGLLFFDTSLSAAGTPIWYTGSDWVNASGTIV